jgi:hypothetical protein
MLPVILHDGPDIRVRANLHADANTSAGHVVVTFSPMLSAHAAADVGFAEEPLNKLAVSNVVFIAKWNHWWQTDEMAIAVSATQRWLTQNNPAQISGYGSSMGAYGALMYSGPLGFDQVLALGPQYSIDRAKVPFESRWKSHAKKLRFTRDDMDAALQSPAEKFVLYDNRCDDAGHLALMHGRNLHKIAIPFGSHAIGKYLKESGQLKPVFMALLEGSLATSLPGILAEARRTRTGFSPYMLSLLDRLENKPHHRRWMRNLAERFIAEQPRNFKLRNKLATYCLEDGQLMKARQHAEQACESNKTNLTSLRILRKTLFALGERAAAKQIAEQINATQKPAAPEQEDEDYDRSGM